MNKTPIVSTPNSSTQQPMDKICPILGAIPIGSALKSTTIGAQPAGIGVHPCVRDRCALWDSNHEQCCYLTKNQNIEQLTDVVFKLIKKLNHE